jgi:hypothetical protein
MEETPARDAIEEAGRALADLLKAEAREDLPFLLSALALPTSHAA